MTPHQESRLAATQSEKEHLQAQTTAMQEKIAGQTNGLMQYDKKVQAMTMDLNNLQGQLVASGKDSFTCSHTAFVDERCLVYLMMMMASFLVNTDRQKNTLQQQLVGLNHRLSLTEHQLEGIRRDKAAVDERFELVKKEKKDVEQKLAVRSPESPRRMARC